MITEQQIKDTLKILERTNRMHLIHLNGLNDKISREERAKMEREYMVQQGFISGLKWVISQ